MIDKNRPEIIEEDTLKVQYLDAPIFFNGHLIQEGTPFTLKEEE